MLKKNSGWMTAFLYVLDTLAMLGVYNLSIFLYQKILGQPCLDEEITVILLILSMLVSWMFMDVNQGYLDRGNTEEFIKILKAVFLFLCIFTIAVFLFHISYYVSRIVIALTFTMFFTLDVTLRIIFRQCLFRMKHVQGERTILLTDADHAEQMIDSNTMTYGAYMEICGCVIFGRDMKGTVIRDVPVVSNEAEFSEYMRLQVVDAVILYLPGRNEQELTCLIEKLRSMGIVVHVILNDFPEVHGQRTASLFGVYPSMIISNNTVSAWEMAVKRLADIAGGLIGSVITVVMLPFISAAIRLDSRGPVFFRQKRIGRNGREFTMFKFRSMVNNAEELKAGLMKDNEMSGEMFKLSNDPRITKVGRFLRRTSLDEFPQFFNVLIGNMSLVGTRPPTSDEFQKYEARSKRRLSMKPGITGIWQVSGRSDIRDFDKVVALDNYYTDNWSMKLDLKILLRTITVVLKQKGSV